MHNQFEAGGSLWVPGQSGYTVRHCFKRKKRKIAVAKHVKMFKVTSLKSTLGWIGLWG